MGSQWNQSRLSECISSPLVEVLVNLNTHMLHYVVFSLELMNSPTILSVFFIKLKICPNFSSFYAMIALSGDRSYPLSSLC